MASPKEHNYQVCDVDVDVSLTENSLTDDAAGAEEQHEETAHCNDTGQTELDRPLIDQPALPSGDVINCKNTLQSFDFRESNNNAFVSEVTMYSNSNNSQTSLNQPTLPNGQVINFKNTLQYHGIPNRNTGAIPNIVPTEARHHDAASARETRNENRHVTTNNIQVVAMEDVQAIVVQDVSAVAIVEGQLFTESPHPNRTICWVIGALTIVTTIVVTGVCSSGKCRRKVVALPPTPMPTSSPSLRPSMTSTDTLDLMVASVVTEFVNNISFFSESISLNGTNAESRALAWLIHEDALFNRSILLTLNSEINNDASFRMQQRYPLLTLWFQQANEDGVFERNWTTTEGWLEYDNECLWYGIQCTYLDLGGEIGLQNVVTTIDFYNIFSEGGNVFTKEGNGYSGSIPPDIGLLTSLTSLDFKSQNVTGIIPESIGRCSKLVSLDLSRFSLYGTLPNTISYLTALVYFDVSANFFSGTLPFRLEQWRSLSYFDVTGNTFSGILPNDIGVLTALTVLAFHGNSLSGIIPLSIGLLTALTLLDIGGNRLSGTLPSSIGELTRLLSVDFSQNALGGTIPESVGNWSQIEVAYFSNNQFNGTVPIELCRYIDNVTSVVAVDCNLPCECCSYVGGCTGR
jgi:hypothetical protein